MKLKPIMLARIAFIAFSGSGGVGHPALAQDGGTIAVDDALSGNARLAAVENWRLRWRFRNALEVGLETFRHGALIGREVLDRDGNALGPVVTEARYVTGGLAGVEIALGNDRAVWIKTPFLRYNARDSLLFTRLSPEQSRQRARVAWSNPFPAG